jgi:syntaxin 5
MYTRMATMVAEHGEIISLIDDDMDIAYVHGPLTSILCVGVTCYCCSVLFQANKCGGCELLALFNMAQGNQSLILKIFLVLILVIFLFVVVF